MPNASGAEITVWDVCGFWDLWSQLNEAQAHRHTRRASYDDFCMLNI